MRDFCSGAYILRVSHKKFPVNYPAPGGVPRSLTLQQSTLCSGSLDCEPGNRAVRDIVAVGDLADLARRSRSRRRIASRARGQGRPALFHLDLTIEAVMDCERENPRRPSEEASDRLAPL